MIASKAKTQFENTKFAKGNYVRFQNQVSGNMIIQNNRFINFRNLDFVCGSLTFFRWANFHNSSQGHLLVT